MPLTNGISAGNGGQAATALLASTATLALWNLQLAESKRGGRVRMAPTPPAAATARQHAHGQDPRRAAAGGERPRVRTRDDDGARDPLARRVARIERAARGLEHLLDEVPFGLQLGAGAPRVAPVHPDDARHRGPDERRITSLGEPVAGEGEERLDDAVEVPGEDCRARRRARRAPDP